MTTTSQIAEDKFVKCFHCGELCKSGEIELDNKLFCCGGCKTVYQILDNHGLADYYEIESTPGTKISGSKKEFDFLSGKEVEDLVLDYNSSNFAKVRLQIPSIHCSSCVWLLENLNEIEKGVLNTRVNFPQRSIQIDFNPGTISLKNLASLLADLGYEPDINLDHRTQNPSRQKERSVLIKLGVAGFCFGNIMLLSFPHYFGFEVDSDYKGYFSLISFLLSLPVVFYTATDYFISAYKGLQARILNIDVPISLGITALFFKSTYDFLILNEAGYFDSLTGLVFFLLIGKWIQQKSYDGLAFDKDFKSYFPLAVIKLSGDEKISTPVMQLKPGDSIWIRNREIVPADSIVLSDSARVDYSFVTGESDLLEKKKGENIYGGARIEGEGVLLKVEKKPSQSYLLNLWEESGKTRTLMTQTLVNNVSKYFTAVIILLALSSAIYWALVDSSLSIIVFTSVLIVACPCALALATPFTLGAASKALARHGFFMRNQSIVERIWNISHIVFDKTGTLSTNDIDSSVKYRGKELSDWDLEVIYKTTSNSTHPYSKIVNNWIKIQSNNNDSTQLQKITEIPGIGINGFVDGKNIRLGKSSDQSQGQICYSIDDEEIGQFHFQTKYRKGLSKMITELSKKYSTSVLSGDNDADIQLLEELFPDLKNKKFRQSPDHKVSFITDLQQAGETVMMLGDGLNDASALSQSDIGISVSENTNQFSPQCDIIIGGNALKWLNDFLIFLNRTRMVLIAAFILSFLYNIVGLGFAITGNLSPLLAAILMPLSSVSIVLIANFGVYIMSKISIHR